jgi:nucleoside-diphosphate-sugar epimerase
MQSIKSKQVRDAILGILNSGSPAVDPDPAASSPRKDQRVLITGGSGFIGACLARRLISAGQDVHLILRPEANLWRLEGLEDRYTTHSADLLDLPALKEAVSACQPQVVYHLATHGAYAFQQHRSTILSTNLLGTANLLDALEDCCYEALVNVGSSSEYGHKYGPMRETDFLAPRTYYAISKAAATLLCQAEAAKGRPVATVRVFSAYGPWEDPRRLVPAVMSSIHRGEAPQVTSGEQPRDFIYVDDVLSLLETVANCPAAYGHILNAGSGRQQTVRHMIDTIVDVSATNVVPQYGAVPSRSDEPETWVADISTTTALTGWTPKYDLRAGVEQTSAWYLEHVGAYSM